MLLNRPSLFGLLLAAGASCTANPAPVPTGGTQAPVQSKQTDAVPLRQHSPQARMQFWLARPAAQGVVMIARAPEGAVSVTFNGAPLPLTSDGFFLLGFDRDAENSASLAATLADGRSIEQYVPVSPGTWDIQHVAANPLGGARTSAEFQARRGAELAQINAARARRIESDGWRQDFIWPVEGRISGKFGSQRVYNGTPGSYHSGLDIARPAGTPFVAPADGVVTLAAATPFTLEGHLLMIDHGMGLSSAFLHCSELLVEVGDLVRQGQVIGKIGATGRASGPHLHWGMKWNAARVDPLLLLSQP
ncbi:MAG: M23 family metallopeptidase [Sphingobium sp.]|nr:MAG: M23 family metallopeptidase [Sphingobium sp.]